MSVVQERSWQQQQGTGGGEGAVLGMEAAPMDEALPELTELLQLTCDNFLSLPTAMQNRKSPTES